ncbi:MAG: metal-dependent transcriptional regulator [Deltaproteobacteria bacterium]|nr:metal-dependent transcriptional regulator [Candidatus Anaeroferrophillus wilburensis]MBN2889601.1 metal-dependent transcriptional regulator [Deltaproteobacteria bacterium]
MDYQKVDLTPNMEDYLETIMTLQKDQKVARVRDIARLMKVKMPSVTGAVKNLAEKGLVNYERYSFVTLTKQGMDIAAEIINRHQIIYDFLTRILAVDADIAELDACRIEHAVSPQTVTKLKAFTARHGISQAHE